MLAARRLLAATPSGPTESARRISPFDHGAVGDGIHDDTRACIEAARAAASRGAWLVFPKGTFLLTSQLDISGAIAGVKGEGGKIRLVNRNGRAGLLIRGLTRVDPVRRPFLIADLDIECQVTFTDQAAVLYGIDVEGVHIVNNRIRNVQVGRGVYLRGTSLGGSGSAARPVGSNVVRNNSIEINALPGIDCFGVEVSAERALPEGDSAPKDAWLRDFVLPTIPVPAEHNVIEGNEISGGYYGISFIGVRRSLVQRNRLRGQIRSISIQHASRANLVLENELKDSLSTSVHLAYGATDNVVSENIIRTSRARGEGLLQAYVGSARNDFYLNDVEALEGGAPKYFIYSAVASNENTFWGNRLSGKAARAYVALESAFNSKTARRSSRSFGLKGNDDHFTDRGMYGTRIVGNEINATADVPVLVLAQVGDDRGDYPLLMCELAGNTVRWTGRGRLLEMSESRAGLLRDIVLLGNAVLPLPRREQLVLPRGGRHFSSGIDRANIPELPGI
ncbi:MAG: right-handed parallel beta-helix repeat-containing protein [Lautropia sp.]|nr:right-handed parallel beta-helix repeat-containing protein [Lautropia sp.]